MKQNSNLNEQGFLSKLFGKKKKTTLTPSGYNIQLGQGKIKRYVNRDHYYDTVRFTDPELQFLKTGVYEAEYIRIQKEKIEFYGHWFDGVFKGAHFIHSSVFPSTFNGGFFVNSVFYGPYTAWKTIPENFISGRIVDSEKKGVLGIPFITKQGKYNSIPLIAIPIGSFLKVTYKLSNNPNAANITKVFRMMKTLDDKNTTIILQSIPNESKLIKISWDSIREGHGTVQNPGNGFLQVGQPFQLLDKNIGYITSLELLANYKYEPTFSDIIDLSSLGEKKSYIYFPSRYDYNEYIESGIGGKLNNNPEVLKNSLYAIKRGIAKGSVQGYGKFSLLKGILPEGPIAKSHEIFVQFLSLFIEHIYNHLAQRSGSGKFGENKKLKERVIKKIKDFFKDSEFPIKGGVKTPSNPGLTPLQKSNIKKKMSESMIRSEIKRIINDNLKL